MKKISRKSFLISAGLLGLSGIGLGYTWKNDFFPKRIRGRFTKRKSKQPNILFILTDQERHPSLLPSSLKLSHRERLYEKATRFSGMQNISGLCSMARGNIYTGLHYQYNGVYENVPIPFAHDLYSHVPTIGTMLQDLGYETAYFGKWHLTHLPWDRPVGKDKMNSLFRGYGFEITDQDSEIEGVQGGHKKDYKTAFAASKFLEQRKNSERPWFAAVNFLNPHDIMFFLASQRQLETYVYNPMIGESISKAPDHFLYSEKLGFPLPENFGVKGEFDKPKAHQIFKDVMDVTLGRIPLDDIEGWKNHENYYLNCLRDVDSHIGTVLDVLDNKGLWDNTIVVFSSDHGELSGAHGLRGKGNTIYRESASVPFAIYHPDIKYGNDTHALASQIDIVPTLLGFAGLSSKERSEQFPDLKGVDLSPAMTPTNRKDIYATGRDSALYQWDSRVFASAETAKQIAKAFQEKGFSRVWKLLNLPIKNGMMERHSMRGIFDGRYKFARYFRPLDHSLPKTERELLENHDLELYDTKKDPLEKRNLANLQENKGLVWEMAKKANFLFKKEVGEDNAQMLPGPGLLWTR